MSKEVVIVNATRTPFGKFGGALSPLSAVELGAHAIREVLRPFEQLQGQMIDEVIMGIVIGAGVGQIPSRQAAAKAGLPVEVRSTTVNKVCASGMKAVTLAAQAIRAGEAEILVAGGMESMSNAPYLLPKARWGLRMGHGELLDSMVYDGLWCAFHDVHMAIHGSNVAAEFGITRETQDDWALRSHQQAAKAMHSCRLAKEISPVEIPQRKQAPMVVQHDESIREDTTLEKLAQLQPIFAKTGTITAGNAPGVSDGASAVLVMSAEKAAALGLKPLARLVAYGEVAQDYPYLATVPALAIKEALRKAHLSIGDLDRVEINEAFAAVTLTSIQLLEVDPNIVNVNGSSIALGHPIGASGARLITTLVHELLATGKRYGAAGICSGAAQGDAVILENLTV